MGFQVTFSKYADEIDRFASSSISSRIQDLHKAFRDPNVKAILTTLGGYNSNGLLKHLDYDQFVKSEIFLWLFRYYCFK